MEIDIIKYKTYEVVEVEDENCKKFKILGLMTDKQFNKKYGNRKILSIRNYVDTKTTSIIILKEI